MDPFEWRCAVYLDTDKSKDLLRSLIESFMGAEAKWFDIKNSIASVHIETNDSFHESKRRSDFLFFRYYLDIEPEPYAGEEEYINFIRSLLEFLWARNIPAIAACIFEDSLPNRGKDQYFGKS